VLTNCDVNVEDIDRALSIYRKPVGLIKGKHTRSKLKPVVPVRLVGHSKREQMMSIDIMYVCDIAFIVRLVSPINLLP